MMETTPPPSPSHSIQWTPRERNYSQAGYGKRTHAFLHRAPKIDDDGMENISEFWAEMKTDDFISTPNRPKLFASEPPTPRFENSPATEDNREESGSIFSFSSSSSPPANDENSEKKDFLKTPRSFKTPTRVTMKERISRNEQESVSDDGMSPIVEKAREKNKIQIPKISPYKVTETPTKSQSPQRSPLKMMQETPGLVEDKKTTDEVKKSAKKESIGIQKTNLNSPRNLNNVDVQEYKSNNTLDDLSPFYENQIQVFSSNNKDQKQNNINEPSPFSDKLKRPKITRISRLNDETQITKEPLINRITMKKDRENDDRFTRFDPNVYSTRQRREDVKPDRVEKKKDSFDLKKINQKNFKTDKTKNTHYQFSQNIRYEDDFEPKLSPINYNRQRERKSHIFDDRVSYSQNVSYNQPSSSSSSSSSDSGSDDELIMKYNNYPRSNFGNKSFMNFNSNQNDRHENNETINIDNDKNFKPLFFPKPNNQQHQNRFDRSYQRQDEFKQNNPSNTKSSFFPRTQKNQSQPQQRKHFSGFTGNNFTNDQNFEQFFFPKSSQNNQYQDNHNDNIEVPVNQQELSSFEENNEPFTFQMPTDDQNLQQQNKPNTHVSFTNKVQKQKETQINHEKNTETLKVVENSQQQNQSNQDNKIKEQPSQNNESNINNKENNDSLNFQIFDPHQIYEAQNNNQSFIKEPNSEKSEGLDFQVINNQDPQHNIVNFHINFKEEIPQQKETVFNSFMKSNPNESFELQTFTEEKSNDNILNLVKGEPKEIPKRISRNPQAAFNNSSLNLGFNPLLNIEPGDMLASMVSNNSTQTNQKPDKEKSVKIQKPESNYSITPMPFTPEPSEKNSSNEPKKKRKRHHKAKIETEENPINQDDETINKIDKNQKSKTRIVKDANTSPFVRLETPQKKDSTTEMENESIEMSFSTPISNESLSPSPEPLRSSFEEMHNKAFPNFQSHSQDKSSEFNDINDFEDNPYIPSYGVPDNSSSSSSSSSPSRNSNQSQHEKVKSGKDITIPSPLGSPINSPDITNDDISDSISPDRPVYPIQDTETETENEVQTSQNKSRPKRKTENQRKNVRPLYDPNTDDLPIALRRSARPRVKPLRHWMGERIIYSIDENGCQSQCGVHLVKTESPDEVPTSQRRVQKRKKTTKDVSEVIPQRITPGIEQLDSFISFKGISRTEIKSNEVQLLPHKSFELHADKCRLVVMVSEGQAQIKYPNKKRWVLRSGAHAYICKGDSAVIKNTSKDNPIKMFIVHNV